MEKQMPTNGIPRVGSKQKFKGDNERTAGGATETACAV